MRQLAKCECVRWPNCLRPDTHKPNKSWVSDITYIRTYEGWLYLATVIDLYSRKIIGWATGHRQSTSLIIEALKKTTHRIKNHKVILHSDQGSHEVKRNPER